VLIAALAEMACVVDVVEPMIVMRNGTMAISATTATPTSATVTRSEENQTLGANIADMARLRIDSSL
jgi:hypothetical protein